MFAASFRQGITTESSSSSSLWREDFGARGEKGLGDAHGWTWLVSVRRREWLSACASASSTTACSPTPSAGPSAGTATSPSASPPTGTRSPTSRCASGRAARIRGAGRARRRGRAAARPLHGAGGGASGRRSCSALGVLAHLAARGGRYDVVHTASFPYFSLLAAGSLRRRGGFRLVVDWHEVWTREYWRDYLGGPAAGSAGGCSGPAPASRSGRSASRACTRERLRREGMRGELTVLEGEYAGRARRSGRACRPTGGRVRGAPHPREAGAGARAGDRAGPAPAPELRAEIFGDGPERGRVLALVREHGLEDAIEVPGFVDHERVDAALRRALCMVLPSRREGYGLVVVEACARGHAERGRRRPRQRGDRADRGGGQRVRGRRRRRREDLAAAILRVRAAGPALRASTAAWYAANARRLSLADSLERVAAAYRS